MGRHAYTFTDALRAARAAWPDRDADETGEAAAAAMDAQEATAYAAAAAAAADDDDEDAR